MVELNRLIEYGLDKSTDLIHSGSASHFYPYFCVFVLVVFSGISYPVTM